MSRGNNANPDTEASNEMICSDIHTANQLIKTLLTLVANQNDHIKLLEKVRKRADSQNRAALERYHKRREQK